MKARVKATGEIVDVTRIVEKYVVTHDPRKVIFEKDELDFDIEDDPDYWTRLEHQYAGMAMQGFLAGRMEDTYKRVAEFSIKQAHALVEKMKEERE